MAYASQLSQVDQNHDLPDELIAEFDGVKNVLSDAEMPYGCGDHAASKLREMKEEEASQLARRIFRLFLKLRALSPAGTQQIGQDSNAYRPPPYVWRDLGHNSGRQSVDRPLLRRMEGSVG